MGGNHKKSIRANVFKVAGAKSLKKTKAKAVNLGLKNIKQKVQDIDAEFVEISKSSKASPIIKKDNCISSAKSKKPVPSQEEISNAAEAIVKMDL